VVHSSRASERGLDRWVEGEVRRHRSTGREGHGGTALSPQMFPKQGIEDHNYDEVRQHSAGDALAVMQEPYQIPAARRADGVAVMAPASVGDQDPAMLKGKLVAIGAQQQRKETSSIVMDPGKNGQTDSRATRHGHADSPPVNYSQSDHTPVPHNTQSAEGKWGNSINKHSEMMDNFWTDTTPGTTPSPTSETHSIMLPVPQASGEQYGNSNRRSDGMMRTSLQSMASVQCIETPVRDLCPSL
jgi:hypothetical protein